MFAETLPQGVAFGHAGAIVSKDEGTRQGKIDALKKAGVEIATKPSDIIELCLPIKICPSYNIVPNPSLERLGFSSGLSLKTDINAGFAGDPKNIIFIENSITKNLNDKEIEDTFSSQNH